MGGAGPTHATHFSSRVAGLAHIDGFGRCCGSGALVVAVRFRLRFRSCRGGRSGRIDSNRPDVLLPATIADEVDAIGYGPERREVRVALGDALSAGAVGVDDPDFLLGKEVLILASG